ncbi:MAG: MFS transporter [Acidimicrobiales bacterium]
MLCAALCIVVLDNTILSVAVPRLGDALGADETSLQWITSAYGLVLAALLLPLAGLGDRFGRKGLLLIGVVVFGASSGAAALANSSSQLIAARCFQGLGGAATMPATLAVLGNVFPAHERGRAIAIWSGASSVAGGFGPIVAGVLLKHFWWGSVFLVNVPFTALVFLAALRLVPTSKDPATPPIDVAGSVIWSGALGAMLFGLIQGGEHGATSPLVVGPVLVGGVLLLGFAAWERHTSHPLLSPTALADRRMQAGMVAVPVVFFSVFGAQFVLTQWLQGVQGLTPLAAGLTFVPNAAAILVGSLVSTAVVARLGFGRTAALGMFVLAAALGAGAAFHGGVAPIVVVITVAGLGVGLSVPAGVELIMGSVPPDQAGQAAGVNETIVEAGGAFGIAVMGSVLAAAAGGAAAIAPGRLAGAAGVAARARFTASLAPPLVVAAVLLVLGAVVVLRRTRRTVVEGPDAVPSDAVAVSGAGVVVAESLRP